MAEETDNHGLNKYNTGETSWEHSTDMQHIEERLVIRDTEANRTNYTPHSTATFIATDTGAVYDGDGSSWNKATRELEQAYINALRTDDTDSTRPSVLGDLRQMNVPARRVESSTPTAAFTLDDGRISVYNERDIWDTLNVKPAIGPTTDEMGTGGISMTWDQVEELAKDEGWEVFNHGKTGAEFATLTNDEIETEIFESTRALLDHGLNPQSISYPGGTSGINEVGRGIASQLYSHGFGSKNAGIGLTTDGSVSYLGDGPLEMNRVGLDNEDLSYITGKIDDAVAAGTDIVLVAHEIIPGDRADEGQFETSRGKLTDVVNYLRNNGMETGRLRDIMRQRPKWEINDPDAGHIRPVPLSGVMKMHTEGIFEFTGGALRIPNLPDEDGGSRAVWYEDGTGSLDEGIYYSTETASNLKIADTTEAVTSSTDYEIQKDGTDGTGIINFKTN